MSTTFEKPFFNTKELVAYTGFSRGYIYKLTCLKLIPYYKAGPRVIMFKKSEIDAWLTRNRVMTKEEAEAAALTHIAKSK